MKPWILLLILLSCTILIDATTVEYSVDNVTWYNATSIDETNDSAILDYLNSSTWYTIRARNDTTNYSYLSVKTATLGGENMGSLAISIFIILINLGVFALPFLYRFTKNDISNNIISKACIVLGLILLAFNTSIMASIASSEDVPVTSELITYITLIVWACWVAVIYLVVSTAFQTIRATHDMAVKKRQGNTGDTNANE